MCYSTKVRLAVSSETLAYLLELLGLGLVGEAAQIFV